MADYSFEQRRTWIKTKGRGGKDVRAGRYLSFGWAENKEKRKGINHLKNEKKLKYFNRIKKQTFYRTDIISKQHSVILSKCWCLI